MTMYPFKFAGGPAKGPWPQPTKIEYSCYVRGGAATAGLNVGLLDQFGPNVPPRQGSAMLGLSPPRKGAFDSTPSSTASALGSPRRARS